MDLSLSYGFHRTKYKLRANISRARSAPVMQVYHHPDGMTSNISVMKKT